jgi:hypothetical protein
VEIDGNQERWTVKSNDKAVPIIDAIRKGKKKSWVEKIIDDLITAPIEVMIEIVGGIVVAFLLWYFGFVS